MEHAEFVKALREAADFFEKRPELGLPYEADTLTFRFYDKVNGISVDSADGLREFARIIKGHIEKEKDDSFYRLKSRHRGFVVSAIANRSDVCERIQVGTKIEPEHIVPAQEEQIVPEREVPVYEWRCPSLLAPEREKEHASADAA